MTHFYMKNVRDDGDADGDDADSGDADSKGHAMNATNWAFAAVEVAHLLTQPLGESEIKIQLESLQKTGVLNGTELAKLFSYADEVRAQIWSKWPHLA